MKLDKKQIPQLVVLGLLVLGCIGYVSFTVLKPPAVEMIPPEAKEAGKSSAFAKAKEKVQPEAIVIMPTATFPDLGASIPRRDPFAVQALPNSSEPPTKPTNFRAARMAETTAGSASSKVPPLIPIGNFNTSSNLSVVPSVENQDPNFVLTGVIRGVDNVAIIRVGDSERHIVKQGQFIDGSYRVLSVSEDGAVLACGNRRIHLRLGGVRNAS